MADLPYPFSRAEGRFYHVALGNGEYIRVALARDLEHEKRRADGWQTVARQLLQQLHPNARLDEIVTEADTLFLDAFYGD